MHGTIAAVSVPAGTSEVARSRRCGVLADRARGGESHAQASERFSRDRRVGGRCDGHRGDLAAKAPLAFVGFVLACTIVPVGDWHANDVTVAPLYVLIFVPYNIAKESLSFRALIGLTVVLAWGVVVNAVTGPTTAGDYVSAAASTAAAWTAGRWLRARGLVNEELQRSPRRSPRCDGRRRADRARRPLGHGKCARRPSTLRRVGVAHTAARSRSALLACGGHPNQRTPGRPDGRKANQDRCPRVPSSA